MAVFALIRGTVLAGRYEIEEPLGRGGMGRVYKALDRVMEEHVAVKVLRSEFMLDPEMSRRFVSEIKLARKIGHRNVCRIHEYGEDGDIRFIVMELIAGTTLKDHLREGPLTPDAAYDVSIQITRGLNAVHELGIVHRDFKTANIMINREGVAKLVDFGIAKHVSADLTSPTAQGMIMGTPEYMSPEQIVGGPAGFHSDIYALGCVVYEVFTGHAPFRGGTAAATVYMHMHDEMPVEGEDAKRLPPPLVPVLRRALAKNALARYESVGEFFHALTAAAAEGGYAGVHRGGLRLPPPAPPAPGAADHGVDTATIIRPGWLHRPAPRSWGWVLGVVAIAVVWLALLSRSPLPDSLPLPIIMPSAEPSAIAAVIATPAPEASPLVAPLDPGPSPSAPPFQGVLTPPPPPRAAATPRSTASPGSATGRPAPSPPAGTSSPARTATGTLRLLVVPESQVSIDGKPLGLLSRREVDLSPGAHTVRIEHPDYRPLQRRVTVREGATESLVLDLAEKGIKRK